MKEFELKYGCNPNQKPSRIFMDNGADLPIEILNGKPGYINFLDAFNSWQLVKEIKEALENEDLKLATDIATYDDKVDNLYKINAGKVYNMYFYYYPYYYANFYDYVGFVDIRKND